MTAPDVIVTHRDPIIRFPRPQEVERGATVVLYWNGSKAANGDGLPGGDAAIDYAVPLAGPLPIWRRGHLSMFGGGWGVGGFCEAHAEVDPSLGFGTGPFGVGPWGCGGGWWEWRSPFLLRDGLYRIAIRVRDSIGNETALAAEVLTMMVAALPRPVTDLVVTYDPLAGMIDATWTASPDLQAA